MPGKCATQALRGDALNIKAFAQSLIVSEHQKRFGTWENRVGSNNRIDFSVFLSGDDVYIGSVKNFL